MTMRATNIKIPKHVILTQTNKTNTFLSPKFEEKKRKKSLGFITSFLYATASWLVCICRKLKQLIIKELKSTINCLYNYLKHILSLGYCRRQKAGFGKQRERRLHTWVNHYKALRPAEMIIMHSRDQP